MNTYRGIGTALLIELQLVAALAAWITGNVAAGILAGALIGIPIGGWIVTRRLEGPRPRRGRITSIPLEVGLRWHSPAGPASFYDQDALHVPPGLRREIESLTRTRLGPRP